MASRPACRWADDAQTDRDFESWAPSGSAHARYVAFVSDASNLARDTNNRSDVFVRDRKTHMTWRVSVGPGAAQANDRSNTPAISAGGRYVAFTARASNLAAETPTTPRMWSSGTGWPM